MAKPRKHIISLDTTPYYHCTTRCVRRAFLCGTDKTTNRCFEHRRKWIENRILALGNIFSIDIASFAVMSNHYHIILHVDKASSLHWSNQEVCQRWHQLYRGTELSRRFLSGEALSDTERQVVRNNIDTWRLRLCDISWFMRALNEPIAREANKEDGCRGRFWESRFSSQALLDEKALAACMAYVDLNPVRAQMANTPEQSDHTSIQRRIQSAQKQPGSQPASLMPFVGNPREPMPQGLPFRLDDYLALVDWTGRAIRNDKRGAIPHDLPPILDRLDIDPEHWLILTTRFESRFKTLIGCAFKLKQAAIKMGFKRSPGLANCLALLSG